MDRREFLQTLPFWALALERTSEILAGISNRVSIERIDLYAVRYQTRGYFKFLVDRRGRVGREAVVIRIQASDGTVGWGESVPSRTWSYETLESVFVVLANDLAPALIGADARDARDLARRLARALAPGFTTGMPIARAGLEIALHDLWGKLAGVPVPELWGMQAQAPIPLSWTVNPPTLDQTEALVEEGKRHGFKHFNIKVGSKLEDDIELARTVRRLAPAAFLWADANGGYDVETAVQAAKALADVGCDVFEAPLRPNQLSGYQKLKRLGALPILMDEGIISPVELEEFIRLDMLDGLAIKPARCGGVATAKLQIETVLRHKLLWLGSGLTDPSIALAASVQLYSAFRLDRPAALNGPQFISESVVRQPVRIERGYAYPPAGPGLGVEVDEGKVQELSRRTNIDLPRSGHVTLVAR